MLNHCRKTLPVAVRDVERCFSKIALPELKRSIPHLQKELKHYFIRSSLLIVRPGLLTEEVSLPKFQVKEKENLRITTR